jgi:hypothetical protein
MRTISLVIGVLFAVCLGSPLLAQDNAASNASSKPARVESETSAQNFDQLRHKRTTIINEISRLSQSKQSDEQRLSLIGDQRASLEQGIKYIDDQAINLDKLTDDLSSRKSKKELLEKSLAELRDATPPDQHNIDKLVSDIANNDSLIAYDQSQQDLATTTSKKRAELENTLEQSKSDSLELKNNIKRAEEESSKGFQDLQDIEDKITSIFTEVAGSTSFRFSMSLAFAALVSTVIFGFFAIAFKDENVRKSIFSSESGIQFITLFLLVIAIIFFGIIGILEGKELAALLGGLSGYILGRGSKSA